MVDFRIGWTGLAGLEHQAALRDVPRETFMAQEHWAEAYRDKPMQDPDGHPIVPPSRLAWQLQAAGVQPGERVLELSRESGYRAAVLASLGARVIRVEEEPAQAFFIADRMVELGLSVPVKRGPLAQGWAVDAPYDLIIIEDAPGLSPMDLQHQLAEGGRILVVEGFELTRHSLLAGSLVERSFLPLGNTLPTHDWAWVPDAGVPALYIEEHTPGFDPPPSGF